MSRYCECAPPSAGHVECVCPTGERLDHPVGALDLPAVDLLRLGEFSVAAGEARARGDKATAARLVAERDRFQARALARLTATAGRNDMKTARTDTPTAEEVARLAMLRDSRQAWMTPDLRRADDATDEETSRRAMEAESATAHLPAPERDTAAERSARDAAEREAARAEARARHARGGR